MLTTILKLKYLILAAMLHMSPLHETPWENPDVRLQRYDSIASDIADVVLDPEEEPVFDGPDGRIKTGFLLASVANNEGWHFNADVDSGKKRGDHGRSICLMQLNLNPNSKYTAKYLLANRKNCLRAGLDMIRIHKCGNNISSMMRSYVSGSCARRNDSKSEHVVANTAYRDVSGYMKVMGALNKYGFPKNNEGMLAFVDREEIYDFVFYCSDDCRGS